MTFLEELKEDLLSIVDKIEGYGVIPDKSPTRNALVLDIAAGELGTKEIVGSGNNARVVEYHKFASKANNVEQPDSVPWCSSFVCWVVEHCVINGLPMGSTNSMAARSWESWGISSLKDPLPGDIVVYWRGSKNGWQGHVGIFLRLNSDGTIVTLGGNQSDEVNVSAFSVSKLLDIRRSSKAGEYSEGEKAQLKRMAKAIIDGEYIHVGGSLT